MRPLRILRRLTAAPPHKTAARVYGRVKQAAGNALRRRFDARHSTRSADDVGPLRTYLDGLKLSALREGLGHATITMLKALAECYRNHEFDLLGSNRRQVRHGIECPGLNGHRYGPHDAVAVDRNGDWLDGRINPANLSRSKSVWKLVDAGYTPIDWQLDFKSGYRWNESTWYRDIPLGHLPGVDIKVPWELARGQHLPQMALLSCVDINDRDSLAREFRNQVLDFIATNPPRFGVNWNCAMDVGIRVANWLLARDLFAAAGATFDDEFENVLAASVYDHAAHIVANLEWTPTFRGNHYLADIAGLLFAAAYLPCSETTGAWLAFAVGQLITEVEAQFLPDGGSFEASTCYHRLSAEMVVWCTALVLGLDTEKRDALHEYNRIPLNTTPPLDPVPLPMYTTASRSDGSQPPSPFSESYVDRFERMTRFLVATTKPDGRMHQVGDNDSGRFVNIVPELEVTGPGMEPTENQLDPRSTIAAACALLNGGSVETECASDVAESIIVAQLAGGLKFDVSSSGDRQTSRFTPGFGTSVSEAVSRETRVGPPENSFAIELPGGVTLAGADHVAFPDFGLFLWRTPRCYLAVRCGAIGQNGIGGHAHNDQLAIELQVDGVDWIADPGTMLYTPDPDSRNRYRSVAAHFAPRAADGREPGRLDRGLFRIDGAAAGECLYAGPDGFIGRHTGFGPGVTRTIRLEETRIAVEDYAEGDLKLQPNADVTPDRKPPCPVPFSRGYGVADS